MAEPDPLAETDIYAGERKCKDSEVTNVQVNPEDTELEDELGDVLNKQFKTSKD